MLLLGRRSNRSASRVVFWGGAPHVVSFLSTIKVLCLFQWPSLPRWSSLSLVSPPPFLCTHIYRAMFPTKLFFISVGLPLFKEQHSCVPFMRLIPSNNCRWLVAKDMGLLLLCTQLLIAGIARLIHTVDTDEEIKVRPSYFRLFSVKIMDDLIILTSLTHMCLICARCHASTMSFGRSPCYWVSFIQTNASMRACATVTTFELKRYLLPLTTMLAPAETVSSRLDSSALISDQHRSILLRGRLRFLCDCGPVGHDIHVLQTMQ